jgi:hypothetical protein
VRSTPYRLAPRLCPVPVASFFSDLRGLRDLRGERIRFPAPAGMTKVLSRGRLSSIFSFRAAVSPGGASIYDSHNDLRLFYFCG